MKTATRKTHDVNHTGEGNPVRVPKDEADRDFRSIAEYAADVLARREYGKRGYCHHVRTDSWTEDGRSATYEAFIGTPAPGGGTVGRNIWVYVDLDA